MTSDSLRVSFGGSLVTVQIISSSAIKCITPPKRPGGYNICITDHNGQLLSTQSIEMYWSIPEDGFNEGNCNQSQPSFYGSQLSTNYFAPALPTIPLSSYHDMYPMDLTRYSDTSSSLSSQMINFPHTETVRTVSIATHINVTLQDSELGKRQNRSADQSQSVNDISGCIAEKNSNTTHSSPSNTTHSFSSDCLEALFEGDEELFSELGDDSGRAEGQDDASLFREHKIRIVEKLGQVMTGGVIGGACQEVSADEQDCIVDWLDDTALSNLSAAELENVMEQYIMTVVKQLVQLACIDDDLQNSLDSLDETGFSLLHYCCLYNLTTLVPVLLAKGVSVNLVTGSRVVEG